MNLQLKNVMCLKIILEYILDPRITHTIYDSFFLIYTLTIIIKNLMEKTREIQDLPEFGLHRLIPLFKSSTTLLFFFLLIHSVYTQNFQFSQNEIKTNTSL